VSLRDGFEIRRMAAEKRVPCFTSLDTAAALADVLADGSQIFSVKPLAGYRDEVNKAE
jgi:carbamoyl-phosphate synthase large subunit